MSVKVESEVYEHSKTSLGTRLVMLAIADNADEETRLAWPSIKTIAHKANLSESAVHRAIRKAVSLGELTVTLRPRHGERHASNLYRVEPYPGCQNDTLSMSPATGVGAANGTQRGSPAAPEPSVEPSENRQKNARAAKKSPEPAWKQVPEGEALTDRRRQIAREVGLHPARLAGEWQKFTHYVFPTPHRSVDQTWQNWCVRASGETWSPPADPKPPVRETNRPGGEPTRLGGVFGKVLSDVEKTKAMLDARDREAERRAREEVGL